MTKADQAGADGAGKTRGRRSVPRVLNDLAYDTQGSFSEVLDNLNLEVRFGNFLTASVQYTQLTRCGQNAADYLDNEDFEEAQADRIMEDLKKQNGVDEAMKARDQMGWVQAAAPAAAFFVAPMA